MIQFLGIALAIFVGGPLLVAFLSMLLFFSYEATLGLCVLWLVMLRVPQKKFPRALRSRAKTMGVLGWAKGDSDIGK